MIEIRTYVRQGYEFIPYQLFERTFDDPMHIEGAIELAVDGVTLLDTSLYDDVDQLWSYIVWAALDLVEGGFGTLLFPDTPIRISLTKLAEHQIEIAVDWPRPHGRRAQVRLVDFLQALLDHATAFFERMVSLVPEQNAAYQNTLAQLARLTSYITR